MALQRHVWSTFDFSEIESELTYNDLRIVWLKMHSVPFKAYYSTDYALRALVSSLVRCRQIPGQPVRKVGTNSVG